jgi:hypothetical protein
LALVAESKLPGGGRVVEGAGLGKRKVAAASGKFLSFSKK